MTDQEIKELISKWKKYEISYIEEVDGYFLEVFLSAQIIEKMDQLIMVNDLLFSDFIADAEFAYLYQNNLQEHQTIDVSDLEISGKELAKELSNQSPYKGKKGYYKVYIPVIDDELFAIYTFLILERDSNPNFSLDDLIVKFVNCFEITDMDKIMELELSAYDEIGEEFEKRKH